MIGTCNLDQEVQNTVMKSMSFVTSLQRLQNSSAKYLRETEARGFL